MTRLAFLYNCSSILMVDRLLCIHGSRLGLLESQGGRPSVCAAPDQKLQGKPNVHLLWRLSTGIKIWHRVDNVLSGKGT